MGNRRCTYGECSRPHYRSGLCSAHYERWIGRTKKPMDAPIGSVVQECAQDGCKARAKVSGYCELHYRRARAGRKMDAAKKTSVFERLRPGVRFGRLTIQQFIGLDDRHRKWFLCRCDCGKEVKQHSGSLVTGNTRSCGCLAREARRAKRIPDDWGVVRQIILQYKRHARSRGLSFDLDEQQFRSLIDAPCAYCGAERSNTKATKNHSGYEHNGIDRVDSNLGYSAENCVPCCRICNVAKNNLTFEQFAAWLDKVAAFRPTRIANFNASRGQKSVDPN